MKVLIACEFSGIVREAFRKRGHDAWSCDLLPAEDGSRYHYQTDALAVCDRNSVNAWDLMIAHPPCTHLACSGARWFAKRRTQQEAAKAFFMALIKAPVPMICVENPIGIMSTQYRLPDQIIQPWWFGHGETKATCLWLKNLPALKPTKIVSGRKARVHLEPPGLDRWKNRSRTLRGIAEAMATQWNFA